jgi:hypothetical protein
MATAPTVATPADILKYRNDLVRTGKYFPLGRMQKIALAPAKGWAPNPSDPIMSRYGRFIELRDSFLPIAHSPDRSMILVTAPLLNAAGRVELPDLPDPTWVRPTPTKEEIEGVDVVDPATGKTHREFPKRDPARFQPRMVKQSLFDRAEGFLSGTNFLIFSPVVSIVFQPEQDGKMIGDMWLIQAKYNAADNTHPTLLVDRGTGETHFFGGVYQIVGPRQG